MSHFSLRGHFLKLQKNSLPLHNGFTLIELLVVIATIGILASVVLASLNSARDKGEDAAIRSNLNNIRSQTQIVYTDSGLSYATVCADSQVSRAVNESNSYNSANCADEIDSWAVEAQLNDGIWYCVDSTGNSIEVVSTSIAEGSDYECGP